MGYPYITIVERVLGRKLKYPEQVHHIDYNRKNNKPYNLVVCPNMKYHKLLHARQRILELGGHPNTHAYCDYHKEVHPKIRFSTAPKRWNGLSSRCKQATNEYRQQTGINTNKFNWKERLNQQYRRIKKQYTKREISWL